MAAAPEGKDCIGIASHASNADCEGGGPGSEFQQADCPYGSDCGPRMPTHAARPSTPPEPRSPALATAFSFVGCIVLLTVRYHRPPKLKVTTLRSGDHFLLRSSHHVRGVRSSLTRSSLLTPCWLLA